MEDRSINFFHNGYKMSVISDVGNELRNIWVFFRNKNDHDVIVQFCDLKLSLFQFGSGVMT